MAGAFESSGPFWVVAGTEVPVDAKQQQRSIAGASQRCSMVAHGDARAAASVETGTAPDTNRARRMLATPRVRNRILTYEPRAIPAPCAKTIAKP